MTNIFKQILTVQNNDDLGINRTEIKPYHFQATRENAINLNVYLVLSAQILLVIVPLTSRIVPYIEQAHSTRAIWRSTALDSRDLFLFLKRFSKRSNGQPFPEATCQSYEIGKNMRRNVSF